MPPLIIASIEGDENAKRLLDQQPLLLILHLNLF